MGSRKDKLKDEIKKISHKAKKDLQKVVDRSKHSVKHKSDKRARIPSDEMRQINAGGGYEE